MILVDTNVLSLAFRRKRRDLNSDEKRLVYELENLLTLGEAAIIGVIRQEVLSGIASHVSFETLKTRLQALEDLIMGPESYEHAAEFYNTCRTHGIIPDALDMTICAGAHEHRVRIFTGDPDFDRYATCLPITLYKP